jgi:hypothetical protein
VSIGQTCKKMCRCLRYPSGTPTTALDNLLTIENKSITDSGAVRVRLSHPDFLVQSIDLPFQRGVAVRFCSFDIVVLIFCRPIMSQNKPNLS